MRCIIRNLHAPAERGWGILQNRLGMRGAEVALEIDLGIVPEVVVCAPEQVVVRERNGHQVVDLVLLEQAGRRRRSILAVERPVVAICAVGVAGGELLATGEQRAVGVQEEGVERCHAAGRRLVEDSADGAEGGEVEGGEVRRELRIREPELGAVHTRIGPAFLEKLTISLQRSAALRKLDVEHRVALAVGEIRADQSRDAQLLVVPFLGNAILDVQVHSVKILLQDEIDDAGLGISAVGRRCASGENLYALDRAAGNRVDVDYHQCVDGRRAFAVDEHEIAVGSKAAQVHCGRTHSVGRRVLDVLCDELADARHELGQLLQVRLYGDRAVVLEYVARDGDDRTGRFEVSALDMATRDHDFLE